MTRLIDADALNAAFEPDHDCDWHTPSIIETINEQPTVEAVPVVRGEWIGVEFDMFFKCSNCEYLTDYMLTNFCPNCGADMRGEKK